MMLLMFAKHLQELGIEGMADAIAEMGFDGVDLTVREGGSIAPQDVKELLPKAVKAFERKGLCVGMLTTSIVSAEDEYAEEIVSVASDLGVKFIKLGYWRYDKFGTLREKMEEVRRCLSGLEKMAEKYGVTFGVHTHSGNFITCDGAITFMLVDGFQSERVCVYVDPGHMTIEGGLSGWRACIDLLRDYIRMVAVKDFAWRSVFDESTGEVKWYVEPAPLAEGITRWHEVFECLSQIGFDGVISIHSEYPHMDAAQIIKQTKLDLQYLRPIIERTLLKRMV
jgi:sugar phosphate isomerase/epimerase